MGPADPFREVLLQRCENRIPPLAVDRPNLTDMAVEEAPSRHLVGHHLDEGAGMEVRPLLGPDEPLDHLQRGDHPAEAQPRGEALGEDASSSFEWSSPSSTTSGGRYSLS